MGDINDSSTSENDNRLTRKDIERLISKRRSNEKRINLMDAHLEYIDLSGMDLTDINLSEAHLVGANLHETNLFRANLSAADLRSANLSKAYNVGNLSQAELREANLSDAMLIGVNLSSANLLGVNLSRSCLVSANLSKAYLGGADLRGADLREANLSDAELSGANLSGADLRQANFSNAQLNDADLHGADLMMTNFSGANLSQAIGVPPSVTAALLSIDTYGIDFEVDSLAFSMHFILRTQTLSTAELSRTLQALTDLCTQCSFIAEGMFTDVMRFAQIHDHKLATETRVVIERLLFNPPLAMTLRVSPNSASRAVIALIDSTIQSGTRKRESESDLDKALMDFRSNRMSKRWAIEDVRRKAQPYYENSPFDIELALLTLQYNHLDLVEQRNAIEKQATERAMQLATAYVDAVQPEAEASTRAMLRDALLPEVTKLQDVPELQLVLPTLPQ